MHMGFFLLKKIFSRTLHSTTLSPGLESLHGPVLIHFYGYVFRNARLGIWDVMQAFFDAAQKAKMRIQSLFWILHFINLTKGRENTRRGSTSRLCPSGCTTCSPLNGCLSCKPRLFFYLELDGMQQRGTCLSSCPRGHYDVRSPHISTCARCKEHCASCFSENFCTHCHPDHFLFRGKCEHSCPSGLTANTVLRECTECPTGCEVCVSRNVCVRCRPDLYFLNGQCHLTCPRGYEPDMQLLQCIAQVHCEVGGWTGWGPCDRKRSLWAYSRGQETRNRQVKRPPSVYGDPCPHVSEIRECVIQKRPK